MPSVCDKASISISVVTRHKMFISRLSVDIKNKDFCGIFVALEQENHHRHHKFVNRCVSASVTDGHPTSVYPSGFSMGSGPLKYPRTQDEYLTKN